MGQFAGVEDGGFRRTERGFANKDFAQQDPEAENVGAGVHVDAAALALFRAHVIGRAEDGFLFAIGFGQSAAGGHGDAEIDDLRQRHAVMERGQHVGGLDVAVDDALLVGVLDGVADADEEFQPLADGEAVFFAETR